jgi:5-methylcytosine-specific restriction endonuclease McrA
MSHESLVAVGAEQVHVLAQSEVPATRREKFLSHRDSAILMRPQRRLEKGHPDRVTAKRILELIESQSFRCAITGVLLTPEVASIDHKNPLSQGGMHCISNAQVVHSVVNQMKGSMQQDEFVEWCRLVVNNAPTPHLKVLPKA